MNLSKKTQLLKKLSFGVFALLFFQKNCFFVCQKILFCPIVKKNVFKKWNRRQKKFCFFGRVG
jgi:hypothetical protein